MNRISLSAAILSLSLLLPCFAPTAPAQDLFASNAYFTVGQTPVKVFSRTENISVGRLLSCVTGGVYFLEISNPGYVTNTVVIRQIHADLSTTNTIEGTTEQIARIAEFGTRLNPTNTEAGPVEFKWSEDFPFKGAVYAVVDLLATNAVSTNATVHIKEYLNKMP